MKSLFLSLNLAAAALIISTFESSATAVYTTVAFSTLDTSGGYLGTAGIAITGSADTTSGYFGFGNEFAPTVSGELDNIGIALAYVYNVSRPELVNVQLVSDSGGSPTGPILASGSVMTDGSFGSSSTALSIFTPSTSVFLTAGTDYWLLITPSSSSSVDVWNDETSGVLGNGAETRDGSTWGVEPNEPLNAFEVTEAVPEPSCLAFALGGLILVAGRRLISRVRDRAI